MESVKFDNLDEFMKLAEEDANFEYTVAWVDCVAKGESLGRGIYMRGNHAGPNGGKPVKTIGRPMISVPIDAPSFMLNSYTVKAFNILYYGKQFSKYVTKKIHYNPFFYPLDAVDCWNRIYGRQGLFQYQFVIPEERVDSLHRVFEAISESGLASFLAVLKKFGDVKSPGMLSFPKKGITLALDFVNRGSETKRLFDRLNEIVNEASGRLYPAKDSHMTSDAFKTYYPEWKEFETYMDPKFSSSLWRRVTDNG
ncbi:MAG: hypothetical protein HQK54_09065 [Oligoflexales bacterium]|nr:hypothetical protein [Oligoflexales bacterium]